MEIFLICLVIAVISVAAWFWRPWFLGAAYWLVTMGIYFYLIWDMHRHSSPTSIIFPSLLILGFALATNAANPYAWRKAGIVLESNIDIAVRYSTGVIGTITFVLTAVRLVPSPF